MSKTLLKLGQMDFLNILTIFVTTLLLSSGVWGRSIDSNDDSVNLMETLNGENLASASSDFLKSQQMAFTSLMRLIGEFRQTSQGIGQLAMTLPVSLALPNIKLPKLR